MDQRTAGESNRANGAERDCAGQTFTHDPGYPVRYYGVSLLVFLLIDIALYLIVPSRAFEPAVSYLFLLPFDAYLGGMSLVFIHNASHNAFRPLWLNRIAGELSGTHQLYGFIGWREAHALHHRYPDDPERDPHPPAGYTFWRYAAGMKRNLGVTLKKHYFRTWGETERLVRLWRYCDICGALGIPARLAFWYLLLGPTLFLFLYLPSYGANLLIASHLNYITHRKRDNGEVEILNLEKGPYYRLANALFFGLYFHLNHHRYPALFNPERAVR